jgi:1-acyl-sn-glycerol-3-phosphate acyltransferase
MTYWFLKMLLGPIIRLIWVKKVEGLENIPKSGPLIIATNHSSYFDFISLIAVCPRRIYFLAAEKFYKSWFWYPIVKLTNQIRVERQEQNKEEVYKKVYSVLGKNGVIGIFPEGTRSADGKIQKTFTGVAKFAVTAKVPVLPVGVNGTYEILPRHKNFPKFRKIIKIKTGTPLVFEEYYKEEQNEKLLREVTDKIMLKIAELAEQKYFY